MCYVDTVAFSHFVVGCDVFIGIEPVVVAAVSLQTSPQLAIVSPDPQRTDSTATAPHSPHETTPTPEQGADVAARPPSTSSVGGKRSTESRPASSGRQSAAGGGDTAAE